MDQPRHLPLVAGQLRLARVAAIVNGLFVLLMPFALMALIEWMASGELRNGTRVTARVSSDFQYVTRILVMIGAVVVWIAPFALIAGWRTWVHARRRLEGRGSGWQGAAEGGLLGFCAAFLILLPGIVTHPLEAPPYVAAYGGMAALLGLVVGVVLRFTALIALRVAGRAEGSPRGAIKLFAILLLALPLTVAAGQDTAAPRVVLTLDKPSFLLGENVLVHFCVENPSSAPITIETGADYRGGSRSNRFKVTVADDRGRTAADPDPLGYHEGGVSGSSSIPPGGRWCQSLPLMRYARVDDAGSYVVRATHDLGWPTGRAPVGEVRVTFAMPTTAQADVVIASMRALPVSEGIIPGTRAAPVRDFSTLRYAVYLPGLAKLAQDGLVEAVWGIGAIPTPDATQTLIELVGHKDGAVARLAQQQLAMRLPDPALTGALAPRSPLGNDLAGPRRYLRDASWRAEFAPAVRAAATMLLASANTQDVVQGAFMLEAVGEPADAPALEAALSRAIELTLTLPFEQGVYPRPRGAAQELMRAADALVARGYVPVGQSTTGATALWLVTIAHGARPDGWVSSVAPLLTHRIPYVRELALDRLPPQVPASLVEAIGANLDPAAGLDTQIAACRAIERGKIVPLRDRVVQALRNAQEFWLQNAASNASIALGSRFDVLLIQASRLSDPAVSLVMFDALIGVLDATGRYAPTTLSAGQGRVLAQTWVAFLTAHREDIEARRRISLDDPTVPVDLVPPGWNLSRQGKPSWPVR